MLVCDVRIIFCLLGIYPVEEDTYFKINYIFTDIQVVKRNCKSLKLKTVITSCKDCTDLAICELNCICI